MKYSDFINKTIEWNMEEKRRISASNSKLTPFLLRELDDIHGHIKVSMLALKIDENKFDYGSVLLLSLKLHMKKLFDLFRTTDFNDASLPLDILESVSSFYFSLLREVADRT